MLPLNVIYSMKMKFIHYILVDAVSKLSMDKNGDTYEFDAHCLS
jgi:hypothetical protein